MNAESSADLRVVRLDGKRPTKVEALVSPVLSGLPVVVLHEGCALLWSQLRRRWHPMFAPAVAVLVTKMPIPMRVVPARTRLDIIHWRYEGAVCLAAKCERILSETKGQRLDFSCVACSPRPSCVGDIACPCRRIAGHLTAKDSSSRNVKIMGILHELIPEVLRHRQEFSLTAMFDETDSEFSEIIKDVRQNPDKPWRLKDISQRQGYSPYHFSRIFKQAHEIGLKDLLERVRLEVAMEEVCRPGLRVRSIAANHGYSGTRALQAALLDMTGFRIDDFRDPPDPDATHLGSLA